MKRVLLLSAMLIFSSVFSISAFSQEQSDSLYAAGEREAYKRYAESINKFDSIANGMHYVNTYVKKSPRRAEVSDRIAYLMASTQQYMAGTPLETILSYARSESTVNYIIEQKVLYDRLQEQLKDKKIVGFNAGIGGAAETCRYINEGVTMLNPVYGGHLLFSVGDYRNFFNFEFGVRYRYWFFPIDCWTGNPNARYDLDFHQLRLVVAPKINIIRQSKKNAFYLYVAPELGYNYPIDMHETGFYEGECLTVGGRAGIGIGRFELSASYTNDVVPMVNQEFTSAYSPKQIGLAMTVYFSGGGRK